MSASKEQPGSDLAQELVAEAHKHSLEHYLMSAPLVVGVSGGADSLALLHLLRTLRGQSAAETLHVAHLNHWFRGKEAGDDANFVRETAQSWGLTSTVESFDVPNYARRHRLSTEEAARRVRYAFLSHVAADRGAVVAVAHNADDQVETVLMSILRGSGIGGLGGMQMLSEVPVGPPDEELSRFGPVQDSAGSRLFRPLLHVWRYRIIEYCTHEGLEPRFDSTNWERTYKRNRVRHDLLPLLQLQYSLAIKDHLYNLAEIARGDEALLRLTAEQKWSEIAVEGEVGTRVGFSREAFAAQPEGLRRRLVRLAIEKLAGTLKDITFEQVEAASGMLANAPGSPTALHLPYDLVVEKAGEYGYIGKRHGAIVQGSVVWPMAEPQLEGTVELDEEIALEFGWSFRASLVTKAETCEEPGEFVALFDANEVAKLGWLSVRTRRAGDYIRPLGMDGHKSLQDLMVDAKIPREFRDRIPLVALDGQNEVLWVPGRGGRRSARAPLMERTQDILQLQFWRR